MNLEDISLLRDSPSKSMSLPPENNVSEHSIQNPKSSSHSSLAVKSLPKLEQQTGTTAEKDLIPKSFAPASVSTSVSVSSASSASS